MLQNRTILIVDHLESDRQVLSESLALLGFECVCFENIYKLISGIDSYDQSVILLDAELPGIVGTDATKALKRRLERSGKSHIYIALSSHGDDFALITNNSGFDDFLQKPVTKKDLQECLLRYFPDNGQDVAEQKAVQSIDHPNMKLYTLDMFDDDEPDFVRSIVEIFVINTPVALKDIRIAFENGDMEAVKLLAHKVKPYFGFFGATRIQKTMQTIEHIGNGSCDKNKFSDLFEKAEKESLLLIAQLKKDILSC